MELENDDDDLEVGSVYAEQWRESTGAANQPGETVHQHATHHNHQAQPGQMLRRSVAQHRRVPSLTDPNQVIDEGSASHFAESARVYSPNARHFTSPRQRKTLNGYAGTTAQTTSDRLGGMPHSPKL